LKKKEKTTGKRGTRLNPTPSRTNQQCDQLDERQLQEPQGMVGLQRSNTGEEPTIRIGGPREKGILSRH
jgi:hypothetical protein